MGFLTAWIWVSAAVWAVIALVELLNWLRLPDLAAETPEHLEHPPFVSIVVPARNEKDGIREAVRSFCRQDYPRYEVVVVEDRSTDSTPQILADLQREYEQLRIVHGHDPSAGWLGKPNALEVGRLAARGDWLLFVDADVVYAPDLLSRAMSHCTRHDVAMLSVVPPVVTHGVIEAALMSTLYLVALACWPAFLVNAPGLRWFAAGTGSMNLVRRDALEAAGAFGSLRDAVVDDVVLGYRVKGAGFSIRLGLSGPLIRLRMYEGAWATVVGFSKNTYPAMRKLGTGAMLYPVLAATLSFLPYVVLVWSLMVGSSLVWPAAVALLLMHVVLGTAAVWFRQPWYVAFLNPVREIGWMVILIRSAWIYHRHGIVWRGRGYGRD